MTTVSSGATEFVSSGQIDSGTIVLGDGTQTVLTGGVTIGTIVSAGGAPGVGPGYQLVSAGGRATGTILDDGTQIVSSGGVAIGTQDDRGGAMTVLSGGIARGVVVASDGALHLNPDATVTALTLDGGAVVVLDGVVADAATLNASNQLILTSAGTVVDTIDLTGSTNGLGFFVPQIPGGVSGITGSSAIFVPVDTVGGAIIARQGQAIYVSSGQLDSGARINLIGAELVASGGVASASTVSSGGEQVVYTGGVAAGTRISGGAQYVSSGGKAIGAFVTNNNREDDNGLQVVFAGGVASNTTLSNGGHEEVYSGGTARRVDVGGSGTVLIHSGAIISEVTLNQGAIVGLIGIIGDSATVDASDHLVVTSGGKAVDSISLSGVPTGAQLITIAIPAGGPFGSSAATAIDDPLATTGGAVVINEFDRSIFVSSGQVDSHATVKSGGAELVISGGEAIGSVLSNGEQFVRSGGTATGSILKGGGLELIYAGGVVSGAVVSSGGVETVFAGGVASGAGVFGGGDDAVSSGGRAVNAVIHNGGTQSIVSGGAASATTISNGGIEQISSGGTARNVKLLVGGELTDDGTLLISGAATFAGTLLGSGALAETDSGDLLLSGAGAGFTGQAVVSSGTIELDHVHAIGAGTVVFAGGAGSETLQVDTAAAPATGATFTNLVSNFSGAREFIDLRSVAFVAGATAAVSGSTLTLSDGGHRYGFHLAGSIGGGFSVTSDGHGGTLINPNAAALVQAAAGMAATRGAIHAPMSNGGTRGDAPLLNATGSASGRA